MTDSQTADTFICIDCGYRGLAACTVIEQRHPYGMGYATEYLVDEVFCESCGSRNVSHLIESYDE